MKAGFSKIDITPPLGIVITGYYTERYADHIIEPLYVSTLAFSDGENTAVAISTDVLEIQQSDCDDIRARVSKATGLPFEAVFITAIHTHTGPNVSEIVAFFKRDPVYYETFCSKICDSAVFAIRDMKDAKVSIGQKETEGIAFVRRYLMKDGSVETNPSLDRKDEIDRPLGKPDETLQLVKIEREGASDIAVVNFGMHPDVIGGNGICPDWPGYFRDTLEAALANECDGKGVKVIFFNGAQGDVVQLDRRNPYCRGVEGSRHIGKALAGAALSIYTYTEPVNSDKVFFVQEIARAKTCSATKEEIEEAKKINERYLAMPFPRYISNCPEIVPAKRCLRLEQLDEYMDLKIGCVGFGDVAFIGMPGEPFADIGKEIKAASPFKMTLACCLANGAQGYFATDDALSQNGYESGSSLFTQGIQKEIVTTATRALNKAKE